MITIRASSLPELLDCPARWEAKHMRGLRLPRSAAAQLGTAIHASTAVYDYSRMMKGDITSDEAAAAAVDAIHKPEEDVDWEEESPHECEKIALALHTKYCAQIAPQQDYIGVEVRCQRLEIADFDIALEGTTDRIRNSNLGAAICDLKTGKQAVKSDGTVDTSKHAMQLGIYELLAEHALGIPINGPAEVIGLQTGKTDKAQRVGVGTVATARDILIGYDDQPGILHYIARMIANGLFYGNPRSYMCNQRYCPIYRTCAFRA
jgi:RecB family exonuclease